MPARTSLMSSIAALAALTFATPASAVLHAGDTWLNFTKQRLDFPSVGQTTPVSMFDYSGKVVVLFILGYS